MPYRAIGSFGARYAAAKAKGVANRGTRRIAMRVAGKFLRNSTYGARVAGGGNRRTRPGYSPFSRAVRKVILNTTEKCYRSRVVASGTAAAVNHDTLKSFVLWDENTLGLFPPQGLSDGERVGDEIYVTGLKIRCTFEMPHDRRNAKIKLWYVPYDHTQGDPNIHANFQHNVSGNTFIDPVQTDRWPGIRYLGMHQLRATDQTTGIQDKTMFRDFWIPIYKKCTFTNDGTQQILGLKERGVILATAYDTYSTSTTDTVVNRGEMTATLYYKCP